MLTIEPRFVWKMLDATRDRAVWNFVKHTLETFLTHAKRELVLAPRHVGEGVEDDRGVKANERHNKWKAEQNKRIAAAASAAGAGAGAAEAAAAQLKSEVAKAAEAEALRVKQLRKEKKKARASVRDQEKARLDAAAAAAAAAGGQSDASAADVKQQAVKEEEKHAVAELVAAPAAAATAAPARPLNPEWVKQIDAWRKVVLSGFVDAAHNRCSSPLCLFAFHV